MIKHEAELFDRLHAIRLKLRNEGHQAFLDGVKIEDGTYAKRTDHNGRMDHEIWERAWYEAAEVPA